MSERAVKILVVFAVVSSLLVLIYQIVFADPYNSLVILLATAALMTSVLAIMALAKSR